MYTCAAEFDFMELEVNSDPLSELKFVSLPLQDDEWSLWFWAEAFPDKMLVSGSFLSKILPGLTF